MASASKVIITCAVTGSSHTPTMSPYLPCTPSEIVAQSVDAAKAGAALADRESLRAGFSERRDS